MEIHGKTAMGDFTFGELLKSFRVRRKMSQRELAARMGKHLNTLGGWERGDKIPETRDLISQLAQILRLNDQETRLLLDASQRTALSPYWLVPPHNPFFTGRLPLLQRLHQSLSQTQAVALNQSYALSGLGGIGKTQLALAYVYRHASEYQAVFWVEAEKKETLAASFSAIAQVLQLLEQQEANQEKLLAAVKRWFATHKGWLLVFDNVEDPALLRSFWPAAREGAVLLTTRLHSLEGLAPNLELAPFTEPEALEFLLWRAGLARPPFVLDKVPREQLKTATALVAAMGALPLALDQAGAYLERTRCPLSEYLRLFENAQMHLLGERSPMADHPQSVVQTFLLSFQKVQESHLPSADMLRLCAFLSPDAIPEELLTEGAGHLGASLEPFGRDRLALDEAVQVLLSYSLIQRDPQTATLSIHRLVQAVLLDTMPATSRREWQDRVIQALNAVFPERVVNEFAKCERLLPHALICTLWIEGEEQSTQASARLLAQTGTYLTERGQYPEAEPSLLRSLVIREQHLGPQHPDTASSLSNLAELYRKQGKYEQAEPLSQRALTISEQQLGPQHPDTAMSLNNLASLYWEQGKYEQAEPLFQRALAIREQQLGPQHPDTAMSLNNLASLYLQQGKYEQAEPLYQQALAIWVQQLGPQHPHTANSLNNLGELYREQGKYEQAEPLYQRALTIFEQQLGLQHPYTANSLNNLGELYGEQGKYEQAEPLFLRALTIFEQQLGPQHPYTAYPLHGLAVLSRDQGKSAEAESFFLCVLSICECSLASTHPDLAETLYDFAILRQAQGQYDEARSLYERALDVRIQTLGPEHPRTIDTRERLVALLRNMGHT